MIDYNRKLSNERKTQVPSQKCLSLYCFIKNLKLYKKSLASYEQNLTTTGPDSKLNSTAMTDIFTLYTVMDSSFWIETINLFRSIVYINGSQVIISK